MFDPERVTYFAETDYRNTKTKFGIKAKDRTKHVYVIGKTGMGKSTLLENMAVQDIQNGEGLALIDPHGATAEKILKYVPEHRIKDVIYFAPFDTEYPISFNIMEDVGHDKRHLVASGLMSAFKKIWADAWSARMEYILNNTILALLEYPGATLLGVNRMLSDKDYRKKVVENVTDSAVKSFWVDEFAKYTDRFAAEATPAIQNKVGQFTMNPLIRNIIGQPKSSFDIRDIMDNRKILIMNLSKGLVGEQNAKLLGSMLVTKIYLGAMSRADVSPDDLAKLSNFYFYVDEFQTFVNETFAEILSEARKYKLNLTIAHQYIEQMIEEVRAAVFGNVGTTIAFRVGPFDAEVLETVFAPAFTKTDLVSLGFAQIYLSLMIDGVGSPPFSATTLPPIRELESSFKDRIVESSRTLFAKPRSVVEADIMETMEKPAFQKSEESASVKSGKEAFGEQVEKLNSAPKSYPKKDVPSLAPSQPSMIRNNSVPKKIFPKPQAMIQPNSSLKNLLKEIENSNLEEKKSPAPAQASAPIAAIAPIPPVAKTTKEIPVSTNNNVKIQNTTISIQNNSNNQTGTVPLKKSSFVLKKDFVAGAQPVPQIKREEPKPIPKPAQTISLKDLTPQSNNTTYQRPVSQKDATPEMKQSLRDALQKAMLEKNIFGPTESSAPTAEPVSKVETPDTPIPDVIEKKVAEIPVDQNKPKKQVPEDLLKKVFD